MTGWHIYLAITGGLTLLLWLAAYYANRTGRSADEKMGCLVPLGASAIPAGLFLLGLLIKAAIAAPAAPELPDARLTPGLVDPALSAEVICAKGWSTRSVRDVPQSLKRQVYTRYGMHGPGEGYCRSAEGCEVDHLIPLTVGGSNDIRNLWPQSFDAGPRNAHVKDKLEVKLHHLVCSGRVPLAQAQHDIATDWISACRRYMGGQG